MRTAVLLRLTTVALALALWGCGPGPTVAAGGASAEGVQRVRLPDGRRLALRCSGQGSPTVILEAGFGGSSLGWSKVQSRLAPLTRVCSYDRAGYGLSDAGPAPRDGAAVARDLDKALKAGRIAGPYVLVGHSAGALYARLFAARRREDVVGMVLVDPSVEHQDRRLAVVFGHGAGNLEGQRRRAALCLRAAESRQPVMDDPQYARCFPRRGEPIAPARVWRTQMSEAGTLWGATSDQVDRIGDLLADIPVVVLSAGRSYDDLTPPSGDAMKALWMQLHQELAARSRLGTVRQVDSGHMMMTERPEAVVEAVGEMVRRNRARQRPAKGGGGI